MKKLLENINRLLIFIKKIILELFSFIKKNLPVAIKKLKSTWFKFKNLRGLSILVSWPNNFSHNYRIGKILLFMLYYAIIMFFVFAILVYTTPLNDFLSKEKVVFSQEDVRNLNALNTRINNLMIELQKVKLYNNRLKFALNLGDSTLYDSSKIRIKQVKKPGASGSLYEIIRYWLNTSNFQAESYYFTKPTNGIVSRNFEPEKGHPGIDFAIKQGSPVFAAGNGYVIFADYTVNDGFMMIVNHNNDFISIYKHCSSLLKKTRDKVSQGEVIALSGNTGEGSSGPHLHFELWKKGLPIDPAKYLIN
ncbi:MAG TPA: M23 family metallopeptidase [Ignavibacteriaceae bacterium]|nr:M23 family metallopeptidase [Ignavibacteriaceae bacterium]